MTLFKVTSCALACFASLASSGCSSNAAPLSPTLLVEPNAQEVQAIVSELVGQDNVSLKDDVFMNQSTLVLTYPRKLDANGNPIMGKQIDMPNRFVLLSDGRYCYVRHINSDTLVAAKQLNCKGASAQ